MKVKAPLTCTRAPDAHDLVLRVADMNDAYCNPSRQRKPQQAGEQALTHRTQQKTVLA